MIRYRCEAKKLSAAFSFHSAFARRYKATHSAVFIMRTLSVRPSVIHQRVISVHIDTSVINSTWRPR